MKTEREQLRQIAESFIRFDILGATQHMLSLAKPLEQESLSTEILQLQVSYRLLLHQLDTENIPYLDRSDRVNALKRRGLLLHSKLSRSMLLSHENTLFSKTFRNCVSRDWKTLWREAIDMDERTKLQDEIFNILWTSELWNEEERLWWQEFMEHQNEIVLQHWLGAITQSLWMFWDEQKMYLLSHFTSSSHETVRVQAVLGCTIVLLCYPDYETFDLQIPNPYCNIRKFRDDVTNFQYEFIRMKECEKVEEKESELFDNNLNNESEEDKAKRLMNVVKQFHHHKIQNGLDLSFSKRHLLHICTFLQETSHWWAPFDESRAEVVKACYDEHGQVRQEYELLIEASHECDLQHYLSCFMLSGENVRLEIQGDVPEDLMDRIDRTPLPIHKRLIHNLYRINYQSPSHQYMKDLFDNVSFLDNPYLSEVISDEDKVGIVKYMCDIELKDVRCEYLEDVAQRCGISAELAKLLAQCCIIQKKDYARALSYLEQADLLCEADSVLLRNMAFCAHQMKKFDREIIYLKRLRQLEPDNASALVAMANLYYQQKDFEAATPTLQELTYRYPMEIRGWGQLIFTNIFTDNIEEAKKNVSRMEQYFSQQPTSLFIAGCVSVVTGQWRHAIDCFRKMGKKEFEIRYRILEELPISAEDRELIYDQVLRQ